MTICPHVCNRDLHMAEREEHAAPGWMRLTSPDSAHTEQQREMEKQDERADRGEARKEANRLKAEERVRLMVIERERKRKIAAEAKALNDEARRAISAERKAVTALNKPKAKPPRERIRRFTRAEIVQKAIDKRMAARPPGGMTRDEAIDRLAKDGTPRGKYAINRAIFEGRLRVIHAGRMVWISPEALRCYIEGSIKSKKDGVLRAQAARLAKKSQRVNPSWAKPLVPPRAIA